MACVFARNFLGVALYCSSLFAFAFLGGFLVELTAADFRQDACLFARALEASHSDLKRLVFTYFYLWQNRFLVNREIKGA